MSIPSKIAALAAALAALLLAACGTSDAVAPGASSPTASGTTGVAAPAQAYVDAVNAGDLEALVRVFATDGQVLDVSRPIHGRDAIRTWARDEVIGGRLQVLSVTPMTGGQDLLVHWAPAGSTGWRAHYRFTMSAGDITLADLQYA